MAEILSSLYSFFTETKYTREEVDKMYLVQPFVQTLDQLSEVFKPLADIAYYPTNLLIENTGLSFFDCNNIVVMILWISLCFIYSQIDGPIKRRLFSSVCGLCIGFLFYGVSYWLNIAFILLVGLIFSIKMPERYMNSYLATFTAIAVLMSRAIYE